MNERRATRTTSEHWLGNEPLQVLVVESDIHSREGLRGLLASEGHRVQTAADGWQAIKRIKGAPLDVAIIDLDLPPANGVAMDGWDLVRILPSFHPAIAVIVVSAEDGADREARARGLEVAVALEKPIELARLRATMSQVASVRR